MWDPHICGQPARRSQVTERWLPAQVWAGFPTLPAWSFTALLQTSLLALFSIMLTWKLCGIRMGFPEAPIVLLAQRLRVTAPQHRDLSRAPVPSHFHSELSPSVSAPNSPVSAGICPPNIEIFLYSQCKLLWCKGKIFRSARPGCSRLPAKPGCGLRIFGIFLVPVSWMMSVQLWCDMKSVAKCKFDLGLGESVLEFLSASLCLPGLCYSVLLCWVTSLRDLVSPALLGLGCVAWF